jgi:N-methylhydantoinase A
MGLAAQGLRFAKVTSQREIDIRYSLQLAEVSTPVKDGVIGDDGVAEIADSFERIYERQFGEGTGFKDAGFQFMTYRVFMTGHLASKPELPTVPDAASAAPPLKGTRRAFLDAATGWVDASVYDYAALRAGHRIAAPAIIEAPTTTVVIPSGSLGTVDFLGNLAISNVRPQAEGARPC